VVGNKRRQPKELPVSREKQIVKETSVKDRVRIEEKVRQDKKTTKNTDASMEDITPRLL
jgi:hypothetical protein